MTVKRNAALCPTLVSIAVPYAEPLPACQQWVDVRRNPVTSPRGGLADIGDATPAGFNRNAVGTIHG